ncbi:MAG: hypothetical protein ACI8X3_000609 [Saprospiraceae bacterium]|jgi:hypothetical protein
MLRKILIGIGIMVLLAGVFLGTRYYYTWGEVTSEEKSQILMEKIKTVAKLVTVEGYFSEVYSYEDYWGYDISLFQKKALIRVKAKVSVGYDLTKMSIEARPFENTLVISNLPDPEIMSIDHDLDYYDLSEGTFNSFSKDDYNKMNSSSKEKIREQVRKSDIFLAAEKQSNDMLDLIRFMVEGAGWKLAFVPRGGMIEIDTLRQ